MTNQPTIDASRIKRYGQWSVKDEKLRITYLDSEESVLFEDTQLMRFSTTPPFSLLSEDKRHIL